MNLATGEAFGTVKTVCQYISFWLPYDGGGKYEICSTHNGPVSGLNGKQEAGSQRKTFGALMALKRVGLLWPFAELARGLALALRLRKTGLVLP